jgi:site-specific DNA recombinase
MKSLKIGAYIRVSTEDQVNVFEGSLDSQKYRINEFVQYKNRQQADWGNIVEFYVEEGVSAGTTNRPVYQKLMSDVRKGKINLILVSDLTRLSRNLMDFCSLINELEKHHASYLSMKEQFDTSTPIGRMLVYIIIILGQFEREQTSERVAVNCHSRALRGLVNGGPAPMGYDKHPDKKGLLVVNESEVQIVQKIFQIFLDEGSRAKAVAKLNELGIRPKRTSTKQKENQNSIWNYQSLGSLIENIAYIGKREVNRVYKDEDPSHLKPWQKYQIVPAAWPAILDEKIFFDAQSLLEEASLRERTRMSKTEKRIFLLTSILTCGITGIPLVGQAGHGSSGTIHRYYHYSRRPKDLKVVRPRLNADELEEKVISELRSALVTQGYFDDLEKTLKSQSDSNTKGGAAEFDRAQKELKDIQNRITSIWTNQSRMQLSEDALKLASDELNRLAKQKQDLEKYLSTLDPKASDPFAFKEQTLFVENQIRWCMQGWAKATPAMRKRLLRRTIKEIVVTQTELLITFWTNSEDRDFSLKVEPQGENSNDKSNIISFGRRKRPAPNANERRRAISSGTVPDSAAEAAGENLKCAVGENQNSSIRSSGNDKIGRGART